MKKMLEKNKGITLVALVITIIVLLILAGVSMSMVLDPSNGLIAKAKQAKIETDKAQENEVNGINSLASEIDKYTGSGTGETLDPATPGTIVTDKNTKYNGVTIPAGFMVSTVATEQTVENGLVIKDKDGNEYVWIPVKETEFTRTYWNGNNPTNTMDSYYTEPSSYNESTANQYPTEVAEYNAMKTQVLKYGGFYIGRYEAGVDTTTLRTAATDAQKVVIKKNVAPYNYVPWGTSMNDASEIAGKSGAVYLSKNLATQNSYTSVVSTLCYGVQWDAMCRYIGDASRTTPKKSGPELTGNVLTDVSKNIYDLAGNVWEWTMEANSTSRRVLRGGYYDTATSVSTRYYNAPGNSNYSVGFRPTLYIQ